MTTYELDRRWSDKYLRAIRLAVGPHLLTESSFATDTQRATDMVALTVEPRHIACRVRRHEYLNRYSHEFTVRAARDSGAETELSKVLDGHADWMFYGFATPDDIGIALWYLLDLDVFRDICSTQTFPTQRKDNGDGTYFEAFDLRTFPEARRLVIDSWASEPFRRLIPPHVLGPR
jgi:hypothetical protein